MKFLAPLLLPLSVSLATFPPAAPPQGAQKTKTLADAIQEMRWSSEKSGPLLALEPTQVRAKGPSAGIAVFKRKSVAIGGVTAIVPKEMVIIDDSFKQSPNMYDGLPRMAKVLYLLKTLDSEQLRKATSKGIGLSDLRSEQKNVFKSLLPRPFHWGSFRVDSNGLAAKELEKGTLSDSEIDAVRLKLSRRLTFELSLRDQPRSVTFHSTNEELGEPGDSALVRDDEDEFDRGDAYGVSVRQVVENKIKPSQLDYDQASMNKFVEFPPAASVGSLLRLIGSATGREIYADLRVVDLKVSSIGTRARAGDLLKAIALMVTGTYRKVGDAYILTSDVTGMGARKLVFALWNEKLRQETYKSEQEWREEIGNKGSTERISYDPSDSLAPNDTTRQWVAKKEQQAGGGNRETMPSQDLSQELRGFLSRVNLRYRIQPVNTDQVGIQQELTYGFVLPDGRALRTERESLGQPWQFKSRAAYVPPVAPALGTVKVSAVGGAFPIMLKARDARDATEAVTEAKAHGFREVWLATRREEALRAAIEEGKKVGVGVRLAIRPWVVDDESTPADPDRTILGDTGSTLIARLGATDEWKRFTEFDRGRRPAPEDSLSPSMPNLAGRWSAFASLARTPGLSGVAVLDGTLRGYEPGKSEAIYGSFGRNLATMSNFGYAVGQRLAFIRSKGIDPIDIADRVLMAGPDLRQPFFLDDNLRGDMSIYDGRDNPNPAMQNIADQWVTFRAKANERALTTLLANLASAVGSSPVYVETRPGLQNLPPMTVRTVVPWGVGQDLPTSSATNPYQTPSLPGGLTVLGISADWPLAPTDISLAMLNYVFGNVEKIQAQQGGVVVDATALPVNGLGKMLDHWFQRGSEKGI